MSNKKSLISPIEYQEFIRPIKIGNSRVVIKTQGNKVTLIIRFDDGSDPMPSEYVKRRQGNSLV